MSLHHNLQAICLIIMGLIIGCTSPPESHNAQVSDARQAPTETPTSSQLKADVDSSKITWIGTKPMGRHHGLIKLSEAHISVLANKIVGGTIVIDMNSIDVVDLNTSSEDYLKLLNHLKSKEFFDVKTYATAKFDVISVDKSDSTTNSSSTTQEKNANANQTNYLVTGNLTIKATTLSITFPCEIRETEGQFFAKARFNIDRTNWGVSYNDESKFVDKAKDGLIHNTVNVGFELVIPKPTAL